MVIRRPPRAQRNRRTEKPPTIRRRRPSCIMVAACHRCRYRMRRRALPLDGRAQQAYVRRPLRYRGCREKDETSDAARGKKSGEAFGWLSAIRKGLRGSWERHRITRRRNVDRHRPSRAKPLRRVLFFRCGEERIGRPGSRGPRGYRARARSAGPAGGNEAKAGYRWRGEPERVRTSIVFDFCACAENPGGDETGYFALTEPPHAGGPTRLFPWKLLSAFADAEMLVVKSSVTSSTVNTAVRFRPDANPSSSGRTSLASQEAGQARLFPSFCFSAFVSPVVKRSDTSGR